MTVKKPALKTPTKRVSTGKKPATGKAKSAWPAPPPQKAVKPATSPVAAIPSVTSPSRGGEAVAQLRETLNQYGLGSLADWAWEQITAGRSDPEIMVELRKTPEYKQMYGVIERRRQAGKAVLSEQEVRDWRAGAQSILRAAGLPPQFYDSQDDLDRFIEGDVSLVELREDRINRGYLATQKGLAEDRAFLAERFGVGEGDMLALWLDPDKAQPLLEQRFASAKVQGAGKRVGYGVGAAEADRIAALGISGQQAEQGFGQLADSRELFNPLDAGEDAIDRKAQLTAAFEGDAVARKRIENRAARRKAAFSGGGGYATGQRGVSGLGSAAT